MKILHTTKALWTGGIETMVCNLANQMCKTEDVSVCTVFKSELSDVRSRLDSNVKYFDLGFDGQGKPFRQILKFYQEVKRGGYDIVNIHGFFYLYMFAIFLLHRSVKFVYTLHSDAYHEGTDWDNKLLSLKKFFFRKGWMYAVCISSYAKGTFEELYGCNCCLIHNGIPRVYPSFSKTTNDIWQFKLTAKTKVFINPARITKAKNQIMLCRVFKRLIEEGFDVALLIAGSNQDKELFSDISFFLSDRIKYIGVRNDIPELLYYSDGMCLPSVFEGFGLVIVEAFSVGCIPVCTPVGGMVDIVTNGMDGILSLSVGEDDYYMAVKSLLLMSQDEIRQMKNNALQSFDKFNIEITSNNYLKLYQSIL